jgi:hypothetical protein
MFGKKSESKPQGRIDSLIGAGTIVEGSVTLLVACGSMGR